MKNIRDTFLLWICELYLTASYKWKRMRTRKKKKVIKWDFDEEEIYSK